MSSRARQLQGLTRPDRATTIPPPTSTALPAGSETADSAVVGVKRTTSKQPRRRSGGRAATTARQAPDHGKHRRAVTVPTALVEQLRERAHELDRYQSDLILDCLAATATVLEREHGADTPVDSPFHRPRRRAHRGRTTTTLTLYLTAAEVEAMDALASRLGLSRSAVVAVALDRGLDHLT